jgi:hypothetical protein
MRGWQQEELLSSISVAQPHPRTLEESFLVDRLSWRTTCTRYRDTTSFLTLRDTQQRMLNCGSPVVPEVCVVPFVVGGRALAVDVVVTSVLGAGTYTLTLDAQ